MRKLTSVIVTRKGQTTIPQNLREKYGLVEGTRLDVIDMGDGVLFKRATSTIDLVGTSVRTYRQLKKRLDEIRREDA
jgi:AbrB family looped-hinge helix DNA binding protein